MASPAGGQTAPKTPVSTPGGDALPRGTSEGSNVQAQVTVTPARASAPPTGPLSPETAAAVLTSDEQVQIAAQGAPRANPPGLVRPAAGQVTRESPGQPREVRLGAPATGPHLRGQPQGLGAPQPTGGAPGPAGQAEPPTLFSTGGMLTSAMGEAPLTVRADAPLRTWHGTPGLDAAVTPGSQPGSPSGPASETQRGVWQPTAPADQVSVHIKKAVGEGKDRVTVRLEPAELGRIEIKLATSSDGVIRAAIVADRAETLDLLQTDARVLERALQDAGLRTNNDSLSFNLRGDGQHDKSAEGQPDGGSGQQGEAGQHDDSTAGGEPEPSRSRHDGALDISV